MLALVRELGKKIVKGLWLVAAVTLVSCASQKEQVALVNDPDAKSDSMIPWNKQEKWETSGGQLAGMTDRR
jgi:hypothetical protein